MRSIAGWGRFSGNVVYVAPRSSVDGYGKPTYGTDVRYDAHLANKQEMVRAPNGQEVESKQQAWLFTTDVIPTTSRLTLSTADVGSTEPTQTQPKILAVVRRFDGGRPHHSVVYL